MDNIDSETVGDRLQVSDTDLWIVTKAIGPFDSPDLRGIWFYGPKASGKTTRVKQMHPDFYLKTYDELWDGYLGQSVVLLDDF